MERNALALMSLFQVNPTYYRALRLRFTIPELKYRYHDRYAYA